MRRFPPSQLAFCSTISIPQSERQTFPTDVISLTDTEHSRLFSFRPHRLFCCPCSFLQSILTSLQRFLSRHSAPRSAKPYDSDNEPDVVRYHRQALRL